MHARIGDRLIVEGDPARTGLIVAVPHDDGTPPYIVKWLASGHIAMVSPGQFARIIPAERREEHADKQHSEFRYGNFRRSVALPAGAADKVSRKIPVRQNEHIRAT